MSVLRALVHLRSIWFLLCEMVDAGRIVPRALLGFHMYVTLKVTLWGILLEKRTAEDVALILGLVGLFVPFLKWYLENGRDWANDPRAADLFLNLQKRSTDGAALQAAPPPNVVP